MACSKNTFFEATTVTKINPAEHWGGRSDYTRVTVPLRNPNLPEIRITATGMLDGIRGDIRIGVDELDAKLLIQGDPRIKQNLTNPAVLALLTKMADGHTASRIEKRQVIWCCDGLHASALEPLINDCVALAEAIDTSEHTAWEGLSATYGLAIHCVNGLLTLRGFVDAHKVRIQFVEQDTHILVTIGDAWPDAMRILPGTRPNAIPTHNPILDPLMSVVGPRNTSLNFTSPKLAENLLAVLHAYPDSSVFSKQVCLVYPGQQAKELDVPLQDALSLAKLLKSLTEEDT